MTTPRTIWRLGAGLTAVGITAGAFGAHTLKQRLGGNTVTWNTASNYAILNGIALLAISQHPVYSRRWAPISIFVGACLFSGSIVGLLLSKQLRVLGPVTPIGGTAMIAGYIALLL